MEPDQNHKHCNQEPGDDPNPWYNVIITGPDRIGGVAYLWGGGQYWQASKNRQVNYQQFDPDPPSWGVLDLTFFRNYFAENNNGDTCFPSGDVQIHSVILNYKKSTGARALIWFEGSTYQDNISVLYQLRLNGVLDINNWPPAENSWNLMTMRKWNMGLANEGNEIQAISCLEEDIFDTDTPVYIDVGSVIQQE